MPLTFKHLSMNLLFVVISPFPVLAIPLSPQDPPALSEPVIPESSHMNHKIIFGIVFVFVLFVIIEIGYACVGSRMPLTRFIKVTDQICLASATMTQIISSLRLYKFFEKAADAIVDVNDVHA